VLGIACALSNLPHMPFRFSLLSLTQVFSRSFFEVPKAGIEPAHPKTHDFESCVTTNAVLSADDQTLFQFESVIPRLRASDGKEDDHERNPVDYAST
jgi:hypothetical protein